MGNARPKIKSRDEILSILDVNCVTGEIFWKADPKRGAAWNAKHAGRRAGGRNSQGYWVVNIGNSHHRAHHIVWLVATGVATDWIDHIDGDRANNRVNNLRSVTRSENQRNRARSANNPSGVFGVSLDSKRGLWRARVGTRPSVELGHFPNFEDAVAARKAAEVSMGFHPNHGKRLATYENK